MCKQQKEVYKCENNDLMRQELSHKQKEAEVEQEWKKKDNLRKGRYHHRIQTDYACPFMISEDRFRKLSWIPEILHNILPVIFKIVIAEYSVISCDRILIDQFSLPWVLMQSSGYLGYFAVSLKSWKIGLQSYYINFVIVLF